MALMDIFRGFASATPAVGQGTPPQPVANGNQQASQQGSPQLVTPQPSNPNATVPNANTPQSDGSVAAIPPAGQGSASPLANFAKLWETDPNAKPASPTSPSLNFDPAKLLEAAKNVDFAGSIPQEIREKIKTGDEQAIMHAMNQVGQLAYAQAIGATSKITEAALQKQSDTLLKEHLPNMIREHLVRQSNVQDNPLLSDPAAAPVVQMITNQVTQQYPHASPQEVTRHVNDMLNGMAQLVVGKSGGTITPKPATSTLQPTTDWDKYFATS